MHGRRLEFPFVLLLFAITTVVLTYPMVTVFTTSIRDPADALLQTANLGWDFQQLLINPLQLYEAPFFYPYPHTLAFTDSTVPQAVLALPLALATRNLALVYNASSFLAFVLSGFAIYLLIRHWGAGLWGGLAAGLVFTFGSYRLIHLMHLDLLSTEWIPLSLLFLDKSLRTARPLHWFLFGLFFLLSALSAFYYAFFTAVLVLLLFLYRFVLARGCFSRPIWVGLVLTGIILLLASLPFGLPYIELARDYARTRSAADVMEFSANLSSYLASITHSPLLKWAQRYADPPNFESVLSPGFFALFLALAALVWRPRRSPLALLLLISLVGVILSLGMQLQWGDASYSLPYRFLYDHLPGWSAMRAAARWGLVTLLGIALLAGAGLDGLLRWIGKYSRVLAVAVGLVVIAALLSEYNQAPMNMDTVTPLPELVPEVYTWLSAQPKAPAVELPMGAPDDPGPPDAWYQYFALGTGKPIVNGFSGFVPPFRSEVQIVLSRFPSADSLNLLQALNVRYVIVHTAAVDNWPQAAARLGLMRESLTLVGSFGSDLAFLVKPRERALNAGMTITFPSAVSPSAQVDGYITAVQAGAESARLDADGKLQVATRWLDSEGKTAQESSQTVVAPLVLDERGTVLPFVLSTPTQVGSYKIQFTFPGSPLDRALEKHVLVEDTAPSNSRAPIQMLSYTVPRRATRGGDQLKLIVAWEVKTELPRNLVFFIHMIQPDGTVRAEFDGPLTSSEHDEPPRPGQVVVREYFVQIPKGLPQGSYRPVFGLIDAKTGEPLPVEGPDGDIDQIVAGDESIRIGAGWNQKPLQPGHLLNASWSNGIDLVGFDWPDAASGRGERMSLTLTWRNRERTADDYTVFVHLVDDTGKAIAFGDAPPLSGTYPTSAWNDGEWIRDVHTLVIPEDVSKGHYTLQLGWYRADTGARSSVTNADGTIGEAIILGSIEIR